MMFSVMQQEKTGLRDGRGMSIYRRLYLCDGQADVVALPTEDAPGSTAVVADGGAMYLLNHAHTWCEAGRWTWEPGGGVWRS